MNWFISNHSTRFSNFKVEYRTKNFSISSDGEFLKSLSDNLLAGIDGYILPRYAVFEKYAGLSQYELLEELIHEFDMDFIHHIKGIFTVCIIKDGCFYLFNDINCTKKYFIFEKDEEFSISANLQLIADIAELEVSPEHAALFCLMEHFVDGLTLFRNLTFSMPATCFFYEERLESKYYWHPNNLFNLAEKDYTYDELADFWRNLIKQYIDYLNPAKIALTLTAGNDSRMILAALLNLGLRPNTFNFGNPESRDGEISALLAKSCHVNYNSHFVQNLSAAWFKSYGHRIVKVGNSMLNIHRAHRYDALEKEMECNPQNEMVFTGDMGGEYIKGSFVYCDYILSKTFRLWDNDNMEGNRQMITEILKERYVDIEKIDIDYVLSRIASMPFIENKGKHNNFYVSYFVDATIHHTQDINLYLTRIKYPVAPFMDVDFLELLFSSKFHKLNKFKGLLFNIPERLFQFDFHINITHTLAPELSSIKYGKQGYFTAAEYLGNSAVYLAKRIFRLISSKEYPPSFNYKKWTQDFSLMAAKDFTSQTNNLVKIQDYISDLENKRHKPTEGYWHNFTNVINLDYIIKQYVTKNEKV
jgi:hypothetical protein